MNQYNSLLKQLDLYAELRANGGEYDVIDSHTAHDAREAIRALQTALEAEEKVHKVAQNQLGQSKYNCEQWKKMYEEASFRSRALSMLDGWLGHGRALFLFRYPDGNNSLTFSGDNQASHVQMGTKLEEDILNGIEAIRSKK
jgi:hypothetical protein